MWSSATTKSAPKTMTMFYDDFGQIVADVRAAYKNADSDPAFKQAADVIAEMVPLCKQLETESPTYAWLTIEPERQRLQSELGTNRLMDVKGDASKLLATKYIELLKALNEKKYWPSPDCQKQWLTGASFLTNYESNFAIFKSKNSKAIT